MEQVPTLADGTIDWDKTGEEYHHLILSPLHHDMVRPDANGRSRNLLVDELERRIEASDDTIEIADFGCGTGNLIPAIASPKLLLFGIDSSAASLDRAVDQAGLCRVDFIPVRSDIAELDLGRTFETIVSINSLLPEDPDDLGALLASIARHLAPDVGELHAIVPSFDTTEYLYDLLYERIAEQDSPEDADAEVDRLKTRHKFDPERLMYADDGVTSQRYHTAESIEADLADQGMILAAEPTKIRYPWALCDRFGYGYFPDAPEEIWDWYIVAKRA